MAWKRDRLPWPVAVVFVVAYGVIAELSGQLSTAQDVSPWYPPVGLSLALVLAFGVRAVPLVFVADALQLIVRDAGGGVLESLAQGLAQAAFWGGTGLLLRPRLLAEPALSRLADVLWFALGILAGSLVAGALGGALNIELLGLPWDDYASTVEVYFVGDAIGALTIAPALLILAGLPERAPQARLALRTALGLGAEFWLIVLATLLVPALAIHGPGELLPIAPLPVAWLALRLGMPAASVGLLVWSGAAVTAFALGDNDIALREISASMVSGGLLAVFAGAVVTEREHGRARLAYLAMHDELTGLPNRRALTANLADALVRTERRDLAVLLVRLTGLPAPDGTTDLDPLLTRAAERLRRLTGPESTIARIGSRRFVVLVEGPEAAHAEAIAARIVTGLERPMAVDGFEHLLGPVVGSARAGADLDPETVLTRAGQAAGLADVDRGASAIDFEAVEAVVEQERTLVDDLRAALDRGELRLAFQPIASIRSGEVTGAEALLRWTHPDRGEIGPAEFVPLAEACGLILPMGRWVLREACRAAAAWPCESDPLVVHVNISPVQLRDEGLLDDVREALRDAGLPPRRLCLELTETALDDLDLAARRILALGELDVRVVLDDFGTGHSSLKWLQRLPVSALKVDRSFVSGVGTRPVDLAIVQATLGLAKLLDLETVAEGVETTDQLAVLREQGCTSIQGYLLCRPISGRAFVHWLGEYEPQAEARDQTMF